MTDSTHRDIRWNLFARELEDILAERGLRLGQLDDLRENPSDRYSLPFLHREKVRRLQKGLKQQKFSVLNPDELDKVINALDLTQTEQIRLRAALLATSIEEMLMDRIDSLTALRAAEQLLPVLRQALEQPTEGELARIRKGASAMQDRTDETTELDDRFEKAFSALDRANLALHLCRMSDVFLDKIDRAQQARDGFQTALRLLEKADAPTRADEAWQVWYAEAQQGRSAAVHLLAQFGIASESPN